MHFLVTLGIIVSLASPGGIEGAAPIAGRASGSTAEHTATNGPIAPGLGGVAPSGASVLTILNPSPLPDGMVGGYYRVILTASGGDSYNNWDISGTLPPGLELMTTSSLRAAGAAMIVGSPSPGSEGTYALRIRVANVPPLTPPPHPTAERDFTLTIKRTGEIVFLAHPWGSPDPVESNMPVRLGVRAEGWEGLPLTYEWNADCGNDGQGSPNGGHGRFSPSENVASPTWWAPANLSTSQMQCTMNVTARAGEKSAGSHYVQVVNPPHPLDGNDLVWESEDGWVAAWVMEGTTQADVAPLWGEPVAVDGWRIAAFGDLDGDGSRDLVWEHRDGWLAAWMMKGAAQASTTLLYDYPVAVDGWSVVASGDLTGDGKADLLWQNVDGYVAMWTMNGAGQVDNRLLDPRPVAAGGWFIAGTGDLNGDGQNDLVWQSPTGHVAAWLMHGPEQASNALLAEQPAATDGWTVVGTADMNADGMVDLLWHKRPTGPADTTHGWIAAWFMNGLTHAETALLTPPRVEDPSWKIVGPK